VVGIAIRKALRLRQRLAVLFDPDATVEIIRWAGQVDPSETPYLALSALPANALEVWWRHHDSEGFTRAFRQFASALEGGFAFQDCDPLADFARRAVEVTRDQVILREAIRGLAALGYNHNRWHVRDVAVGILQSIREDGAAVSALEGLRMAASHRVDGRPRDRQHPAPDPAGRDSTDPWQPRSRAGPGANVSLYPRRDLRELIEQHRDPASGAITLTGLATQLNQLRASLEAVADNVRRHEEHLRKMKRPERAS
jgi:hypothetical protein